MADVPKPVTQQYYNFKDFPIISQQGAYSVSDLGTVAISEWTTFVTETLFSKLPLQGANDNILLVRKAV